MERNTEFEMLKLENQLCFPLYAASRKVVSRYTPLLKPLGITYTQYIVFMVLWEELEISVGNLGKKLHLDNGTLTPMLKKMEDSGLITRNRDSQDERVVVVKLTEKGESLKELAKDIPKQMGACLSISDEDAKSLYKILYKIIDSI